MNGKFWCSDCKKIFTAEGIKKEWNDPIYGPCKKYVTECPECKTECNEYREPSVAKRSEPMPQMSCSGHCHGCEHANQIIVIGQWSLVNSHWSLVIDGHQKKEKKQNTDFYDDYDQY